MLKKIWAGYRFELCAALLVICASALRLFLAYNDWPQLNADEGVMGIMARHIQTGELPTFFYGQNYMGALEAYLGAGLFPFFGSSTFSLRLGLILLFAIFLACIYMLTVRLYTKRFALFILLLFSTGSNAVLSRQLNALGGYIEILLCGTLSFLLVLLLSLSAARSSAATIWRKGGYLLWGCIVGIGIWSDLLILPAIACSTLLLLYFCWADLKRGHFLLVLLGLIVGALPLILYNLHAAPGQDSWSILISMQGASMWSIHTMWLQISRTMLYSLPTITDNPFCHTDDLSGLKMLGFEAVQPMNPTCSVVRVGWSCIYLALLLYASVLLGGQVWKHLSTRLRYKRSGDGARSSASIRACTAFAIALQAFLTLYSFMRSHAPLDGASVYSRYLICLWIALPTLLWPLWDFVSKHLIAHQPKGLRAMLIIGLISAMMISLSYGTYETLTEVPQAKTAHQQEEALIAALAQHHITHVYTDYWTCYRLAFQSAERITCGVIKDGCSFQPDKHNKYQPYYDMTRQDAHAAYLLQADTSCAPELQRRGLCHQFTIGAYAVFDASSTCTRPLTFKLAQPFVGDLFFQVNAARPGQ